MLSKRLLIIIGREKQLKKVKDTKHLDDGRPTWSHESILLETRPYPHKLPKTTSNGKQIWQQQEL